MFVVHLLLKDTNMLKYFLLLIALCAVSIHICNIKTKICYNNNKRSYSALLTLNSQRRIVVSSASSRHN